MQRDSVGARAAEVLDTFTCFRGIQGGDWGFSTAVGLVKGIVGMVLVLSANWFARRIGDELGANAEYVAVPFVKERSVILDETDVPYGDSSMPRRQVFTAGSVAGAQDFGLCNQDPTLGGVGFMQGTLQVPDSYIRNNRTRNPNFTPNNMTGIVQGDGRTIAQMQPTARCVPGGPIFGYRATDADLYGKGISGGHFGSGISSIGGAIRMGELTGYGPMRHALQIDINMAKYASGTTPFRWPADRADFYHFNQPGRGYCSQDPCKSNPAAFAEVGQGLLLALPPDATPESLGIRTEVGRKIFYALQNYGAYIVDDTGWVFEALGAEYGVKEEVQQKYDISLFAGAGATGPSADWYSDWTAMYNAAPTATATSTPTATPVPVGVRPVLECVAQQDDGYVTHFGYQNDNSSAVTVAAGAANKFAPSPQDRGQPTAFLPGRQQDVFSVAFDGNTLVWSLQGRTNTAARDSKRCP